MSLKVTIEGQGSFEVAKECVKKVVYKTDIPLDSNARTKDVGSTLEISGKILTATDGDPFDSTRQMGLWSMVPAENSACYRKVTVEIIQAGIVERKYYFPNAFVVNYFCGSAGPAKGTDASTRAISIRARRSAS